jgi:hypothetical protein
MQWIDTKTQPPTAYGEYFVLVAGRRAVAEYHEYHYDVRSPTWSVDGVTHYCEPPPIPAR